MLPSRSAAPLALLLPLLVLPLTPALAADDIEWSGISVFDRLPGELGWGGGKGPNTSLEVTPDGLRLVDAGTSKGELNCYSLRWGARPETGALVQATLKLVSCTASAGICLHASDGVHEDCLTFYPDRLELSGAKLSYAMNTTDGFHTYQLRICGRTVEVWADGKLVIDGWGKLSTAAYEGRCVVQFGSISSPATGEAIFKEVRYAVNMPPAVRVPGAEDVVIYRKEGIYACFPSLRRLDDGRLVTSFGTRVRRSHIDGTGGSATMVSSDGGRTWAPTTESLPDPRYRRADGVMISPYARGWIYVDEAELPKIKEQGRSWMKAREGTIAYLGDPMVRVTAADGTAKTVSLPPPTPAGVMTYNTSAFVHTGKLWLTAIYGKVAPGKPDGVWVVRSGDDGETWEVVPLAVGPSPEMGFDETALCDNGRGEIIAVLRPAPESHHSYQCFSSDGGKTWSAPVDTGFWGYPSNVIRLQDGRLLCCYGYRRDRMGIRAVLSTDGGHTWDVRNELVIRADGHGNGGDNGYPISLQMEDGHIFTIYYLNDASNVTHIAGTHWSVPK